MNTKVFRAFLMGWLIFSVSGSVNAQLLSPEDAVATALENNYTIRIARLDQSVLENNVAPGNAGFLPQVDLSAGQNSSITNARQEYLSGQLNERNSARSKAVTAGASLNWTIFNGFRMFNAYARLKQELKSGEIRTRLQVENTIAGVLSAYYNIVQLKQKTTVLEKAVRLGEERVDIAREKLMLGAGSRLGMLQAEVDLNTDKSSLLDLNEQISEASIALNQLMARDAAQKFAVEDTFNLMPLTDYNVLKAKMEQSNPELLLTNLDIEQAMYNLKDIRGRRSPMLGLNFGYNFNDQSSESGFLKTSRTSGINYGISANMSLFDGFNLNRQQQNARIGIESAELRYQAYLDQLRADLLSAYTAYTSKLQMVTLEKQNLKTALISFEIAGERYRLGELSGIEYREAQKNQLMANERLINSIYEVRLLEIALLQLSGSVLPD